MNEEQQKAYRQRVERATSDPAVADRLTRRLVAIETLVCGRPGHEATIDEPIFIAGMRLTPDELNLLVVATGRDGRDCVHVAFDIDDLDAEPAIAVLRPEGEFVTVDHGCRLWVAPDAKRAVIVPTGEEDHGCYAFRAGSRLVHAANRPADRLEGGMLRAEARVRRHASFAALADATSRATRNAITLLGGGVLAYAGTRVAA